MYPEQSRHGSSFPRCSVVKMTYILMHQGEQLVMSRCCVHIPPTSRWTVGSTAGISYMCNYRSCIPSLVKINPLVGIVLLPARAACAWPADCSLHGIIWPSVAPTLTGLQIFPRNATETPALLSSIERNIASATHDAHAHSVPLHRRAGPTASCTAAPSTAPAAGPSGHGCGPATSANTAFRIYSKALDEFIAGFPSYMPLMREIKQELDAAVNDAVRCAIENVSLRRQSTEARRARAAAVEGAYKKVGRPLVPSTSMPARRHHRYLHSPSVRLPAAASLSLSSRSSFSGPTTVCNFNQHL